MDALAAAEQIDQYRTKCKESPLNFLARKGQTYSPWMDQTLSSYQQPGEEIIVMNPTAEGGLPHTRPPNIIAIPAYHPPHMLEETLRHERVHLHQRKFPRTWEARAVQDGWVKIDESRIPTKLLERTRLNPDTVWAGYWAWEGTWVPLCLFLREDRPNMKETTLRWYNIKDETSSVAIPSSFTKKYGALNESAMEHPFELWAYI
jgi:hypothetical protein